MDTPKENKGRIIWQGALRSIAARIIKHGHSNYTLEQALPGEDFKKVGGLHKGLVRLLADDLYEKSPLDNSIQHL